MVTIDNYLDNHYIHRSNWLRAAVLGANDGIISISSLAVGIAAAGTNKQQLVLATVAALVAGALSMSAGEYVSVSSQTDTEKADIDREKQELATQPQEELQLLAEIYQKRGLSPATAMQVAQELTQHNALEAHVRDELGITDANKANALQAAFASAAAFLVGGLLPLLVVLCLPIQSVEIWLYVFAIIFLIVLGAVSAKAGGASIKAAVLRISFWGSLAMGITAFIGHLFNVKI